MTVDRAVESLLRRDRVVVIAGLVGVTILAWLYLVSFAAGMMPAESMSASPVTDDMGDMAGMESMAGMDNMGEMTAEPAEMTTPPPWTWKDGVLMFGMWAIMMAAMMTPSATPMILLYALVTRKRIGTPYVPTGAFYLGYLVLWVGFSAGATILQWALGQLTLVSPMMVSISTVLTAVLLIAAGLYQWTPAKNTCLRQCRSPVDFLSKHWRAGRFGAFRMGLEHGLYCLGCCWTLMLLLFVGGVMNLLWVAAIALLILVEKVAPLGRKIGLAGGLVLVIAGVVSLF
jgi:predicted metal-binding membrane protein